MDNESILQKRNQKIDQNCKLLFENKVVDIKNNARKI